MKPQFKPRNISSNNGIKLTILGAFLFPTASFGFGESICFNGSWYNCVGKTVPSSCYSTQTKLENPTSSCLTYALNDTSAIANDNTTPKIEEAHYIDTYIVAQALGMRPEAAYWVAIYGSVPDHGAIFPVDKFGNKMSACSNLKTESFEGTNRNGNKSQLSGGTAFHFPNRYNTKTNTGANPDFSAAEENSSTSLMNFVLQERTTACIDGIASDSVQGAISGSGATCYHNDLRSTSSPSGSNPEKYLHYPNGAHGYTGDAIVSYTTVGTGSSAYATNVVYLDQVQTSLNAAPGRYLGGQVPAELFSLALALHTKADRISHAECLDNSPMTMGTDEHLLRNLSDKNCSGKWHAWRHFMEWGTGYLNSKVTSFVAITYDDISAFLFLHPEYLDQNPVLVSKAQLQADLGNISIITNAQSRMQAYDALLLSYGMRALAGHDASYTSGQCPSF